MAQVTAKLPDLQEAVSLLRELAGQTWFDAYGRCNDKTAFMSLKRRARKLVSQITEATQ